MEGSSYQHIFLLATYMEEKEANAAIARYPSPKLGDLVLRPWFNVDKSLGMEVISKWDRSYHLSKISKPGVSWSQVWETDWQVCFWTPHLREQRIEDSEEWVIYWERKWECGGKCLSKGDCLLLLLFFRFIIILFFLCYDQWKLWVNCGTREQKRGCNSLRYQLPNGKRWDTGSYVHVERKRDPPLRSFPFLLFSFSPYAYHPFVSCHIWF